MILFTSDRFIEHETPNGHPEQAARGQVMLDVSR